MIFKPITRDAIADLELSEFGFCYRGESPAWWAATDRKGIAAFCGLDILAREDAAFLCLAWVRKDCRGSGLQRRMIRLRERAARNAGKSRCITYTAYDNVRSANSLIGCGYKMYTPAHPWGLEHANYWYRSLH